MANGWTVYVLESTPRPDQRYTGLTSLPLARRLDRHNNGDVPSTARHRPWQVAAAIWLSNESKARELERYLKSGSGRAFAKRHLEQQ